MYSVTFRQESSGDVTVSAALGDNLLSLALDSGVYIDAPCSGLGSCGKCRVLLIKGSVKSEKSRHLSEEDYNDGWRLACQSAVDGDATVMVPAAASAFKSDIRTADFSSPKQLEVYEKAIAEVFEYGFERKTNLETISVKVAPPSMDDTTPDNERLIREVMKITHVKTIHMSNDALKLLPSVLRENDFNVKCLIQRSKGYISILDVKAQDDDSHLCGVAIDIGTTTVSAVLLDLNTSKILARASAGNGQIRYGADVINRIIQASKPGGRLRLREAVREETIFPLIGEMCRHAGINTTQVCRAVIAANTTMNHLFAGIPADSIRLEPYVPVFRELPWLMASEFNLPIHPEAGVVFAPNVGSYVGGDISAGTLVTMMWTKPEVSLFIDLGTNGELVLGSSDFLLCCACSAGPAFEGGDISCGMRATTGAVEGCRIDRDTMEPELRVIGPEGTAPAGLCGSGIISMISELFRCGIINSRGKFIRDGHRVKRDEYGASYVLSFADGAEGSRDVELSEVDIDNFIRAKGAIFSAICSMLDTLDMEITDIDHIYIAGGIGSGIDLEKAISIGMLPALPLEKYSYIGNSSLTGACAMLLSSEAEWRVHKLERSMTYLELSSHPGYMDEFVAACFLPHTDASLFTAPED